MLQEFKELLENKIEKELGVEKVNIDEVNNVITVGTYSIQYVDGKATDTITVKGIGNPKTLAKIRGNSLLRSSLELINLVNKEHTELNVLDFVIANNMVGMGIYEDYILAFGQDNGSLMFGAGYRVRARVAITNIKTVLPSTELINEVVSILDDMFENNMFFRQDLRLEFKATMQMALDAEIIDSEEIMEAIKENLQV